MNHPPIYLDNNATTPLDPRVLDFMMPFFTTHFGNAASATHWYGWEARDAVEEAREQVAELLNTNAKRIVFTSGATEAVNLALKGVLESVAFKGKHLITCTTEHKAVLDTCRHLEKNGVSVTYLPVGENGLINLQQLEDAVTTETVMMAIMYVNNETGVVQPVKEMAAIAQKRKISFFCDATQAAGKIPLDVERLGVDLLACSAHKLYGPKGIGALYIRKKSVASKLVPQIDGGGHERGFRSGTLNVPAIVGFGKACAISSKEMETDSQRIRQLRDRLESGLLEIPSAVLNGDANRRLYNVSNISFAGVDPQRLMMSLSRHIAISSGSACTSVIQEPSHVLSSMGFSDERARNAFRFSLGRFTTSEDISLAVEKVSLAVSANRS